MRVVFDTDTVLDLLLDREPFATAAAALFSRVEQGQVAGFVCATTVTTVHYLAAKVAGRRRAHTHVQRLLALCDVAPVTRAVLEAAFATGMTDYEDAVVAESARSVGADAIATRNVRDYGKSRVPAMEPTALLSALDARS